MAVITGTEIVPTTWESQRDADEIIKLATQCAGAAANGMTVCFVSETHNVGFDLRRRNAVLQGLANDDRIILVVERGMITGRAGTNVVEEDSGKATSSADSRNVSTLDLVKHHIKQTDRNYNKVVVFLFGDRHEGPIKTHIVGVFDNLNIRWIRCPSITDHIANEPVSHPATFSTVGMVPAGYVEHYPLNPDYLLQLLQKGRVHEAFNAELVAPSSLFSPQAYAFYFANQTYHNRVRGWVMAEGSADVSAIVRFNGAHVVKVVLIAKSAAV